MARLARFLVCLGSLIACAGLALPAHAVPGDGLKLDDHARCPKVEAGKPIKFDGQTLIETPDLPPELRLANALIGANCLARAKQVQSQFLVTHPDDYRISFIDARLAWASDNERESEAIGDMVPSPGSRPPDDRGSGNPCCVAGAACRCDCRRFHDAI